MIGHDYFELRARLGTALYALSRLGEQVRIHPARVSLLQNLISGLKEPFLFVVAGEVNSGKSTFLNGLFGEELCAASVVPMTSKIHYFKFGEQPRDVELNDTLLELYRPNAFLKDFHLVDTPGTNSIEERHQDITEHYIPMADLVIFVFSVTNPWGAANWELLERIHHKWFKNVVFVLQQCDLRTRDEVVAIAEHLRRTARDRLDERFPVFCVSAKKALLAKTSGIDKQRLWLESGFEELERFTSESVSRGAARMQRVHNTTQTAQVILGEVSNRLGDGVGTLSRDRQLLERLERAVEKQMMLTQGKFTGLPESVDADYMTLGMEMVDALGGQLTIGASLRSLFSRDDAARRAACGIIDGLGWSVREKARQVAQTLGADLAHLRNRLVEYIEEYYDYDEDVCDDREFPALGKAADALVEQMVREVTDNLRRLELETGLESLFDNRRRTLRGFCLIALLGAGTGIGLAVMGFSPYSLVAAAMGVLALAAGGIYASRNAINIEQAVGRRLEDNRDVLGRDFRRLLGSGVEGVFGRFINLFRPLLDAFEEHRETYEPQIQQLEDLAATFKEIREQVSSEPARPAVAVASEVG
ncbi:MAG: dynamin family protein [Verrucomicrobiales bacterium]